MKIAKIINTREEVELIYNVSHVAFRAGVAVIVMINKTRMYMCQSRIRKVFNEGDLRNGY